MKVGSTYKAKETYTGTGLGPQDKLDIRVVCAMKLNTEKPSMGSLSITGKGVEQELCGCVYSGVVKSSIHGFFKGTRVAAIGISNAGDKAEEITADIRVCTVIPDNIGDQTVLLAGFAAPWINMLKTEKPPMGSMIRVAGEGAEALCQLLRRSGYRIAEEGERADYFFPADKNATGEGKRQIEWNDACGADWNDPRLFSTAFTFPPAYVNNCVLDNVRTFWEVSSGIAFDKSVWPFDRIIGAAEESSLSSRCYLPEDEEFLTLLKEYKCDLVNRKKPITIFVATPSVFGTHEAVRPIRMVLAWIGAAPSRINMDDDNRIMAVAFEDGSAATIQFTGNPACEQTQLHFDGKSIMIDKKGVHAYDCTGIGEYTLEDNAEARLARTKFLDWIENK